METNQVNVGLQMTRFCIYDAAGCVISLLKIIMIICYTVVKVRMEIIVLID